MAELILRQGASIVKSHHMSCATEAQPLHGHACNPLGPLLAAVRDLVSSACPSGKVNFYNHSHPQNARYDMGFIQLLLLINMPKI